jgi:rhodanese-related sulfurtransferase
MKVKHFGFLLLGLLLLQVGCAGYLPAASEASYLASAPAATTQPPGAIPLMTSVEFYTLVKSFFDPVSLLSPGATYLPVDAREFNEWINGHIPAAVSVPSNIYQTDTGAMSVDDDLQMLPKDVLLVFYDEYLDQAAGVAQRFLELNESRNLGYDPANVRMLSDGFKTWKALGYPTIDAAQ